MPNSAAIFPTLHPAGGVANAVFDATARVIERAPTGVAAFVGRTLKGPINRPVAIAGFGEFQQIFGGLWQPSTVSYAVEQFFENGGRRALVVRVVNGARPPTLTLRAGAAELHLVGLNPGSREYLRASVDYDGIDPGESDRFNLIVQRLRAAPSEQIEDQEIFRRVSIAAQAERSINDILMESHLVRVLGALPPQRPNRSMRSPHAPCYGSVICLASRAICRPPSARCVPRGRHCSATPNPTPRCFSHSRTTCIRRRSLSCAAPPLLSNLFAYFTSAAAPIYFPGAAFFAASAFLAVSALVFSWTRKPPKNLTV